MRQRHPKTPSWQGFRVEGEGRVAYGAFRSTDGRIEVLAGTETRRGLLVEGEAPLTAAGRILTEIAAEVGLDALADPPLIPSEPVKPPNNLVGLGLLAGFLAFGAGLVLAPQFAPFTFAFVLAGWILAVMAHEFAHAATAYLGGDVTVAQKGYLAFDPRRYADLGVSLVLPVIALALGGIGFPGGAVWLRNDLMRGRRWRAAASLAGPAATLAVLLLLATTLRVWTQSAPLNALADALALLAFLQATALILNLLPLPGLDGFNAIRPFLPPSWMAKLARWEGLTMVALLLALLFVPGVGATLFRTAAMVTIGLGVPSSALQAGWDAFHFWR